MSETKMRMTNEWLGRVQQLRADVDALRADIHPVRVCGERVRLPEWGRSGRCGRRARLRA